MGRQKRTSGRRSLHDAQLGDGVLLGMAGIGLATVHGMERVVVHQVHSPLTCSGTTGTQAMHLISYIKDEKSLLNPQLCLATDPALVSGTYSYQAPLRETHLRAVKLQLIKTAALIPRTPSVYGQRLIEKRTPR